jgi:hypothetical protein
VWQQCVQQVQHNVLLVLQLTKHWQDGNKVSAFQDTYFEYHSRYYMDCLCFVLGPKIGLQRV